MTTWYHVQKHNPARVIPVPVSEETKLTIVTDGRRRHKVSEGERYFPTELEAWEWLLDRAVGSATYLAKELAKMNGAEITCRQAIREIREVKGI